MIPPLLAVFSWPLAGLILFKRMSLQAAVLGILIGGYLLLPERAKLDLPILPAISKNTMPSFVAIALAMIAAQTYFSRKSTIPHTPERAIQPGWLPRHKVPFLLFLVLMIGEALTVLTNGDRLVYGPRTIPGLRLYDVGSRVLAALMMVMPLLLGRKLFASPEQHKTLVLGMIVAGLIYTLPTLWEVRMSPQLSLHVYGSRVASWIQHVRNDGFRPVVFLNHGLWLAIFMAMSVIGAMSYIRIAQLRNKPKAMMAAGWLLLTLMLMNSLGGQLIALLLVIPAFFMPARMQMVVAACFAGLVLLYPMTRGAGLVPVDQALSYAEKISPARAQSLGYRFRNEDLLLAKAQQRPLFGWGSWGRNQVYNEEGQDISVTDGRWVIEIGSNGWLGYLTRFGLLCVPIIFLTFRWRNYPTNTATAALALMLAANLIDLIPNATLTPITWLIAGALIGRMEYRPDTVSVAGEPDPQDEEPRTKYRRKSGPRLVAGDAQPAYTRQKTFHKREAKTRRHG